MSRFSLTTYYRRIMYVSTPACQRYDMRHELRAYHRLREAVGKSHMTLQIDNRSKRPSQDLCILMVEEIQLVGDDDAAVFFILEDLEDFIERGCLEDGDPSER